MRVSSGTTPSICLNILWDGWETISLLITLKKSKRNGSSWRPNQNDSNQSR